MKNNVPEYIKKIAEHVIRGTKGSNPWAWDASFQPFDHDGQEAQRWEICCWPVPARIATKSPPFAIDSIDLESIRELFFDEVSEFTLTSEGAVILDGVLRGFGRSQRILLGVVTRPEAIEILGGCFDWWHPHMNVLKEAIDEALDTEEAQ